jgi:hypothetical protein
LRARSFSSILRADRRATPGAFATPPKKRTIGQIEQFRDHCDALAPLNFGRCRSRTKIEHFLAWLRDIGHNQ